MHSFAHNIIDPEACSEYDQTSGLIPFPILPTVVALLVELLGIDCWNAVCQGGCLH
jgi:hypothetical protein